jgi:hypothetical protein
MMYSVHLPYLRLEEPSIRALGGVIAPMDFSVFERLDPYWATKNYYNNTSPVFWAISVKEAAQQDYVSWVRPKAMLLYYALLAVTKTNYPSPLLSAGYSYQDGAVTRNFGIYDRTLMLNQVSLPALNAAEMSEVVGLATSWDAAKLHYRDEVFYMLEVFSTQTLVPGFEIVSVLPLLVSLEGFLLPSKVPGIATELHRRILKLLGDKAPEKKLIKDIYTWRSNVIHGIHERSMDYATIYQELLQLCADIVLAGAQWLITPREPPGDLTALKTYLSK